MNQSGREGSALTRRHFLELGTAGTVGGISAALGGNALASQAESPAAELSAAIAGLEPYLTPPEQFRDVSRGMPIPHSLPDDKLREVGLTRDQWKLEVLSDPENPAKLGRQFTQADQSAFTFDDLMRLAEKNAVRFSKVMTCLNIGCPLGMGIWEGVPLRDVVWLTKPRENVRRVFYYGYHNDDPQQMFLSSLPLGRVLEDPFDLPPVILCYKLNGQWLDSQRGGPVRIVVPEAYGFKSIKWLSHLVLTNLAHANDTYAAGNNDLESPLKSFAATLKVPGEPKAGERLVITGYAQVGISGISKVQYWLSPADADLLTDDKYFIRAPWRDAEIVPPPQHWGGGIPEDRIPSNTLGFDDNGRPKSWPMRLAKVHWAAVLPAQDAGEYTLRCRAVDEKGIGQPLPRPQLKSGHAAIEQVTIRYS